MVGGEQSHRPPACFAHIEMIESLLAARHGAIAWELNHPGIAVISGPHHPVIQGEVPRSPTNKEINMTRMSESIRSAAENPKCIKDVKRLAADKRLEKEWKRHCAEPGQHNGKRKPGHPNPWVYDVKIGLAHQARAVLLRPVFKAMLYREKRMPKQEESWQICIAAQSDYNQLFRPSTLSEDPESWLKAGSRAALTLRDPNWHQQLCDGTAGDDGIEQGRDPVAGLNVWFADRYQRSLSSGRMTPELLFETPFFGPDALERFVQFVCMGECASGTNRSLQPNDVPPLAAHHLDKRDEIVNVIRSRRNGGKPIISVRCAGAPTVASALARSLQEELAHLGYDVCYVCVAKHFSGGRVEDAGFQSIIDVLYGFVKGLPDIGAASARGADATNMEQRIAAIRASLLVSPKVFLFVGYDKPVGSFPAIVEFIRDEPLGKLLRLLQHPTLGGRRLPPSLKNYNASFFVVIGETHLPWLTMAQQRPVDVPRVAADVQNLLSGHSVMPVHASAKLRPMLDLEQHLPSEWQLNVMDFLIAQKALQGLPSACAPASFEGTLQAAFAHYWGSLLPWQKTFYGALSLSETGLRFSTSLQILDAYARVARFSDPSAKGKFTPTYHGFQRFLEEAARIDGPALLMRYPDGQESELTDPFQYPSQAITPLHDLHPWSLGNDQDGTAPHALDFIAPQVRELVRPLIRHEERSLLHLILCELALQAYRIRVRTAASLSIDPDVRADRSLVEAIFHGMLAVGRREDWAVAPLSELSVREVPPRPADGFTFLYFGLYRALLCRGDLTNLGRQYGNGDLELELQLLPSHPIEPGLAPVDQLALREPAIYAHVPSWFERHDPVVERRASTQHLLAISHCAKRASRLDILKIALEQLKTLLSRRQAMEPQERLALSKLTLDFAMHSSGRGGPERRKARAFLVNEVRSIVQCSSDPQDADKKVAIVLGALRCLRHQVDGCVRLRIASAENPLKHKKLAGYVDEARSKIARAVSLDKLPADAISLLTRMAVVTVHAADVLRAHKPENALSLYLSALCLLSLSKKVASARMQANPLAQPSRIAAHTVEELVRAAAIIQDLCRELGWTDCGRLLRAIERMVRGTLDTYTREHPRSRADRVTMLILESAYARSFPSDTIERLCKTPKKGALTGDYRLESLIRCLRWLHVAELALLPVSGRPSLRVALCNERIRCLVAALDNVCREVPGIVRPANAALWSETYPMLEWVAHDLRQLDAFIEFLLQHSPGAQRERIVWRHILRENLDLVASRAASWQVDRTNEWTQAHRNLLAAVGELDGKLAKEDAGETDATSRCAADSREPTLARVHPPPDVQSTP